jgi:hypothetical protein
LRPEIEPRERDLESLERDLRTYEPREQDFDPWAPPTSWQRWRDPVDRSEYPFGSSRPGGTTGRRTVTITGRGAEAYAWRNGITPSRTRRRSHLRRYQRPGFRPDRVAFWAVLLGVLLILAAATSSHAAVLVTHHFLSLR